MTQAAPAFDPSAPVAIVTGGAGAGIGAGITTGLLAAGWRVLAIDRDAAALAALAGATNDEMLDTLTLDVAAPDAAPQAVARALERFGRLDGLVNSAGVGLIRPLGEVTDEEFDRLVAVDFRATFRFCRAALPQLIATQGAIVNIGSIQAHRAMEGYGLYAACKAAVEALTRALAVDYGQAGVRANCVHPGFVPSPQGAALIATFAPDVDTWIGAYAATKQALPTPVAATQVGRLVAFLLSAENRAITGQALTIDGGTTALLHDRAPAA